MKKTHSSNSFWTRLGKHDLVLCGSILLKENTWPFLYAKPRELKVSQTSYVEMHCFLSLQIKFKKNYLEKWLLNSKFCSQQNLVKFLIKHYYIGVNGSFTRFTTFQVNYLFGFFVLVCSSFFYYWPQLKFVSILGEEKFSKVWPFVSYKGKAPRV